MRSAGIIKVSTSVSSKGIAIYNTKDEKTTGEWKLQSSEYSYEQVELVSFKARSAYPNMTIHQKGNIFAQQVEDDHRLAILMQKDVNNNLEDAKDCFTIFQSFEYSVNPELTPKEVHAMGEELWNRVHRYMKERYNYDLDNGLISTHIDKDSVRVVNYVSDKTNISKRKVLMPHLHNHIVIPNFNHEGKSISHYLRRDDIYSIQRFNDIIISKHDLNDYHFEKLDKSFADCTGLSISNDTVIQNKILKRFKKANHEAMREFPNDYKKAKEKRNEILKDEFKIRWVMKKDILTDEPIRQVMMNDVLDKNGNMMPLNVLRLNSLLWANENEFKAEKMLKHFDFKDTYALAIPYSQYTKVVQEGINQVKNNGDLDNIDNPQKISIKTIWESIQTSAIKAKEQIKQKTDELKQTTKDKFNEYRDYLKSKLKELHAGTPKYKEDETYIHTKDFRMLRLSMDMDKILNDNQNKFDQSTKIKQQTSKHKRKITSQPKPTINPKNDQFIGR